MPSFRVRCDTCRDCWFDKSSLEKFLIIAIAACLLVIVVLSSVGKFSTQEKVCQSSECLKEASRILAYIEPELNPCDNFYQYTCQNFLKNAGEEERISLDEYKKNQLINTYKEKIKPDEHRMVRSARKLFQTCTDEVAIEQNGVQTLKEVLKMAGGWPVLEGESWKANDYDWKESTFKLRELGYVYGMFIEVLVVINREKNKYTYQVSSPEIYRYHYGLFNLDTVELMTKVVEFFLENGNRTQIREEMEQVHSFWETLRKKDNPYYMKFFKRYTVEEYQKFTGPFDWLNFINRIVGPTASIKKTEYVLFPDPQNLTSWLDIIDNTPKRVQANYMMWKVVESIIPYLNRELKYNKRGLNLKETHEEFCLEEVERKFYPSPIAIINDRRHITREKNNVVNTLLENMRSEFIKIIENTTWIDKEERNKTVNSIAQTKFLVAQPVDYFSDKILDDLDVDVVTVRNETFLNLIAQATRNTLSWMYSQIRHPLQESYLWRMQIWFSNGHPEYSILDNSLFIPGVSIQDLLFHERRPHYLNYGSMAALLGYHLSSVLGQFMSRTSEKEGWNNKTKLEYRKRAKCLSDSMAQYQKVLQPNDFNKKFVASWPNDLDYSKEQLGLQIAYSAYDSWLKNHGDELKLIGLDYTPRQLFWISAGVTFCTSKIIREDYQVKPEVVLMSIATNRNFARDFECPKDSAMDPPEKCQIFS